MLKIWMIAAGISAMMAQPALAQQVMDDSVAQVGHEKADAAVKAAMGQLKDPSSAQFKSFTHPDPMYHQYPQQIVCGMVNAKNGFGGYNGFVPFGYHTLQDVVIILADSVVTSPSGELAKAGFKSMSCASALGVTL